MRRKFSFGFERPGVNDLEPLMSEPPVQELSEIAAAIADGRPVDWAAVESASFGADAADVIEKLKTISEIVALHSSRSLLTSDLSFDSTGLSLKPVRGFVPGTNWGHLTILERIGEGRFGVVYRAWDATLEREVALKILRQRDAADSSEIAHEGRLMARIHHPNVVTVFGAQRVGGEVGIWMQLVGGRTLEDELTARGPFPADDIVRVGGELCLALAAVHAVGLIHRDVKAANVMRDASGRIVLGDFGAGRFRHDSSSGMAGTPLYLAPEVLAGEPATPQSDIYSLGVLLFHLATGQYPIHGRSIRDIRDAHLAASRVSVADPRSDLAPHLVSAIDRAITPEPAHRWISADELR
jgi:eukaryotic-like serine/threonine-protein kinase